MVQLHALLLGGPKLAYLGVGPAYITAPQTSLVATISKTWTYHSHKKNETRDNICLVPSPQKPNFLFMRDIEVPRGLKYNPGCREILSWVSCNLTDLVCKGVSSVSDYSMDSANIWACTLYLVWAGKGSMFLSTVPWDRPASKDRNWEGALNPCPGLSNSHHHLHMHPYHPDFSVRSLKIPFLPIRCG